MDKYYMLLRLYTFFLALLLMSCTSESGYPGKEAMEEPLCSGTKFVKGHFDGICASSVPSWGELDIAVAGIETPHRRIAGLCNPNGFGLRLDLDHGTGWVNVTVDPNDCTEEWEYTNPRIFAIPLDPWIELSAACGESHERTPAPIEVEVALVCVLPVESSME